MSYNFAVTAVTQSDHRSQLELEPSIPTLFTWESLPSPLKQPQSNNDIVSYITAKVYFKFGLWNSPKLLPCVLSYPRQTPNG